MSSCRDDAIKSFLTMPFMSTVYPSMSQGLLMKQMVLIILEFGLRREIRKCGTYYSESCSELFKNYEYKEFPFKIPPEVLEGSQKIYPVVIVGPIGLSLAIDLAQRGIKSVL